jgi:predicted amidohydrolase
MLRTTFWILMAAAVAAAGEDNLVPNADFALDASGAPAGWKTWAPRSGLALDSRVVRSAGGNALSLAARSAIGYGSWVAVVAGIAGGTTYEFEALYRPLNVPREDVSVAAIVSWCGGESGENAIQRDYADRAAARDGWTRVSRTLTAPKGARSARIELVLRWSEGGSVMWKNVRLSEAPSRPPRFVRVATTRIAVPEPNSTLETNFNLISKMLDKAGEQRPDIVLLSENLADRWVDLPVEKTAEPVPGRLTALLGEKARKYRMYVATSLHENADGIIYNTGVLIGRNGEITGKYRKVHLPLEEAENGITPGGDYPVFETDFGRVGMMICYDYWFSEPARILRLNGAELLLLPIAGDGDRLHWDVISRARAIDNGVYLAASSTVAESSSAIIAPTGKVLSETSEDFGVAVSEIDLNREYRLLWLSVGAEGEARSLYIKERQPHTYGALAESNRTAK